MKPKRINFSLGSKEPEGIEFRQSVKSQEYYMDNCDLTEFDFEVRLSLVDIVKFQIGHDYFDARATDLKIVDGKIVIVGVYETLTNSGV